MKTNPTNNQIAKLPLSPRELAVLKLISKGLNYKEIAEKISISPSTVRKHTEHIYKKMEVHNKIEAITKAAKLSLL